MILGASVPIFFFQWEYDMYYFATLRYRIFWIRWFPIFPAEIKSDYFSAQKIGIFFQECGIKTTGDDDDDDDDDDDGRWCAGLFPILLLKIIAEVESDKII